MLTVLVWNSIRIAESHLIQQTENRINEILPLLNASLGTPLLDYDIAVLEELLVQIIRQHGVRYVELSAGSDRPIIAYGTVGIATITRDTQTHRIVLGREKLGELLEITTPIIVANRVIGNMRVQFNISYIVQAVQALRSQGAVIATTEVVLSIVLLTLLGLALTRHLKELTDATKKLSDGDLSVRVPENIQDEIGQTARAFNQMAATRMHVESALQTLASTSVESSNDFFEDALKMLNDSFASKYAFIGLLDMNTNDHIYTKLVADNDQITDNFNYPLEHTPCENVVEDCKQLIPNDVRKLYPKDDLLHKLGLESYFGAPLSLSTGQKIGLVVVTHTQPITIEPWMDLLLDIFANRISMELERDAADSSLRESERYNRMLFEESPIGLVLCRMDGVVVDCNPAYAAIIGRSIEETKTLSYWDITPIKYTDEENRQLTILEEKGNYGPYEKEYIHRDGHLVPVRLSGKIIYKDGERYIWSSVEDISERKQAQIALGESEAKLQAVIDNAPALISIKDMNGRVTMLNRRFNMLARPSIYNKINKDVSNACLQDATKQQWVDDIEKIELNGTLEIEEIIEHEDGSMHTYHTVKFPVLESDSKEPFGICSISTDISERKQAEETIRYLAYRDSLTGLYNRNEFEARMINALNSAHEHNHEHVLLYLDLDQFKVVNDTSGHSAGDEMLRQLSTILLKDIRDRDTMARLGGDEFGLLMENCPLPRAEKIASDLIELVSNFRFTWEGRTFAVGVSIGIARISKQNQFVAEVLKSADMACYAAKDAGRNRYHIYSEDDQGLAQRQNEMHWVSIIREALDEDNFIIYHQPIISLDKNKPDLIMYEHLVRMRSKEDKVILPGSFISSAERYNLMQKIDRYVIREVLSHADSDFDTRPSSTALFINLSGTSLNDDDLVNYIRRQFHEFKIEPCRICFEITETAAIANLQRAAQFTHDIRELGCRIALDDFGSGLSSFSYLKALPVDFIKIDGGFVRRMLENSMDIAIVEAIHQLGQAAGIETIAEFVEDLETMERMRSMGINFAQGYAIAKPESVRAVH